MDNIKEYDFKNIDECFRDFFKKINFFHSSFQKDFYTKDYLYIQKFLKGEIKELPFSIYDYNDNTLVYNFYNIFIIKFTTYERIRDIKNKLEKYSFLEEYYVPSVLLKLEKNINDKFNCLILQPFVLSLKSIDEIMEENRKNLNNINENIMLLRSFFNNRIDASPTNIGVYNGKLGFFDL